MEIGRPTMRQLNTIEIMNLYPVDTYPVCTLNLISKYKHLFVDFVPTTMEEDLKKLGACYVLYYYPQYVDILYLYASNKVNYIQFFGKYNFLKIKFNIF
jgi:hypothetical protein